MQIVEMPPGQSAPEGANRIIITPLKDGTFQVDGEIAVGTVAICFSPTPFASEADALTAALAWACDNQTDLVVIERQSVSS
jgi:hypothetical protein